MLSRTLNIYRYYGQACQELTGNRYFAVSNLDYTVESLTSEATGLKVMMGAPEGRSIGMVCLDIDMKDDKAKGLEVVKQLTTEFPFLKTTRNERTKGGGFHFFLNVESDNYKGFSKLIFTRPFGEEMEVGVKPTEIEVFLNAPITVAPTITDTGSYVLNPNTDKVTELPLGSFQKLLHRLQEVSQETTIVKAGGGSKQRGEVDIDDNNVKECVELFSKNGIKYSIGAKSVQVWSHGDTSSNSDYILNDRKMLWNLKTYNRISVKDFIIEQTGGYIERKVEFGVFTKKVMEYFEGEVIEDETDR